MSFNDQSPEPVDGTARAHLALVGTVDDGVGDDAVALRGEDVLLARVALPLASRRQREAAAGFAVEDLIAEPLDAVHVVLGPELGPGEYLVAVVRHAVMAEWTPRTDPAHPRLVPDVLALPVPPDGGVSVRETNGRVLLRRSDGTGFATRIKAFRTFLRAEGLPRIVLFGGRLPEDIPVDAAGLMPPTPPREALTFDLMTGRHARDGAGLRRALTGVAAVALLALTAHGAILGAETVALRRIADQREALVRAELATRVPDLPSSMPLVEALRRATPTATQAEGGGFLPLFVQVSKVLLSGGNEIGMRNLTFDSDAGSLAVLVEGPDLATLQRVETGLDAAGLAVTSGAATSGDGVAEVHYVIGEGGR